VPKKGGRKMKSFGKILGIIGIIIVAAFASQIGKVVGNNAANSYSSSKQDSELEGILLKTSKQINSQLPMMVDDETRLELTLVAGKNMSYKYTMINYKADEFSNNEFSKELRKLLIRNQCSTENTKKLLKYGIKYNYMYFDKDGVMITSENISKKDCNL
jgi:hypothetical protein